MLEGPLPGPVGLLLLQPSLPSPNSAWSPPPAAACRPTLSLAMETSLEQRPSLVLHEKVSRRRDRRVSLLRGPGPSLAPSSPTVETRRPNFPIDTPEQGTSHTHRPGHTHTVSQKPVQGNHASPECICAAGETPASAAAPRPDARKHAAPRDVTKRKDPDRAAHKDVRHTVARHPELSPSLPQGHGHSH